MCKYTQNYIDLRYWHKQGSNFSVNLYFVYNLLSYCSREINIYDSSLENAVDFYCADQKKMQSSTHHCINVWNQLTKLL